MASTEERRGVPFRSLAWVGLVFVGLGCVGAWIAYFELLHYRRCAVEHLPAETELAARLDVEQVVLFEPMRRHLLPLIDRLPIGAGPSALGQGRLLRLRRDAGVNLGLDLREILIATTRDRRWVLVLGGLFPHTLLPGLARVLTSETSAGWTRVGDILEFAPSGAALGQAADGVLILASDRSTLAAALPSSERFAELGLAREGAGGARLSQAAIEEWAASGAPWLGAVRSAGLELRLAQQIEIDVQLELRDEAAARLVTGLAQPRLLSSDPSPTKRPLTDALDPWGLLARADHIETTGTTVKFVTSWRQTELDRAARDLAAWLERRLAAKPDRPLGAVDPRTRLR
ncbi:MAG: hypothetical protein ABI895_24520 [Deltaproteobacteria bacterium]